MRSGILRRRNLPPPDAFPIKTATGFVYDCGDYHRVLDTALDSHPRTEWIGQERRVLGRRMWGRHRNKPPQWWETCGLTEEDLRTLG